MKQQEDYLWELQGRLFDALGDVYKGIDRNFVLTYSLSLALVLFDWAEISEFSLLGTKLKFSEQEVRTYIPLLLGILYSALAYQLQRLAGIYGAIRKGVQELKSAGIQSIPLNIDSARHFESGVAGLLIAMARWQARSLLRRRPFAALGAQDKDGETTSFVRILRLTWDFICWTQRLIWVGTLLFALYLLPLIISGNQIRELIVLPPENSLDLIALFVLVLIVVVGVATIVCAIFLFITYFSEMLESIRGDLKGGSLRLADFLLEILIARLLVAR